MPPKTRGYDPDTDTDRCEYKHEGERCYEPALYSFVCSKCGVFTYVCKRCLARAKFQREEVCQRCEPTMKLARVLDAMRLA